jgi:hypothetical protein
MATTKPTKAELVALDEARLAADKADAATPEVETVDGASAKAREQQLANSKARADALDEAAVVAAEVSAAKTNVDQAHAEHVAAQAKHSLALAKAEEASRKAVEAPDGMIITAAGLPNSCSVCGRVIAGDLWYARSEDAARSGGGFCADDAQKQSDKAKARQESAPVGPRTFGEKSVANQTELQAKEDAARRLVG